MYRSEGFTCVEINGADSEEFPGISSEEKEVSCSVSCLYDSSAGLNVLLHLYCELSWSVVGIKKQIKKPISPANFSTVTKFDTAIATKIGRIAATNFIPIRIKNVFQVLGAWVVSRPKKTV